jgi:hypothetical protein
MVRRRSRCAYPVSEPGHDPFGSSDEDREGERALSHGPLVLDTLVHVKVSGPVWSVRYSRCIWRQRLLH